jgi:guanylate kinase
MSRLIIVTAPSGSGKTTIVRHLLNTFEELSFSISATTRPPRPHEIDGVDYYFIDNHEFIKKIANEEFLEWQEVYAGRFYGTLKSEVERLWANGKSIIFDVDVKGALNIKRSNPANALAIFIRPPSLEVLEERLHNRKTETEETIRVRLAHAKEEIRYENKFDNVIVNEDLEVALEEATTLVRDFLSKDKGSEYPRP